MPGLERLPWQTTLPAAAAGIVLCCVYAYTHLHRSVEYRQWKLMLATKVEGDYWIGIESRTEST